MTKTTKLTNFWQTVCTVGYDATLAVERTEGNASKARGGVCLCQARLSAKNGYRGRKVNTTGHPNREIGYAFDLDAETLARWEQIARDQGSGR